MLKLKNIKMNNGIISAEYDPENSGVLGSVSVDIKSGEIVDSKLSEYDKDFPVYLGHAVACLEKLALQDSVPEERRSCGTECCTGGKQWIISKLFTKY